MREGDGFGRYARLDVSRETLESLKRLEIETLKWSAAINLIARGTESELWSRHIQDSAQLLDAAPAGFSTWCDIGAGGGFPALVLAILCRDRSPSPRFALIESDRRKSAFLKLQVAELGLSADVFNSRIESLPPFHADVVSARALASLPALLGHAFRHLAPGGVCLFPKGRSWREEVELARRSWQFEFEPVPSIVDPDSAVLVIRNLRPMETDR